MNKKDILAVFASASALRNTSKDEAVRQELAQLAFIKAGYSEKASVRLVEAVQVAIAQV